MAQPLSPRQGPAGVNHPRSRADASSCSSSFSSRLATRLRRIFSRKAPSPVLGDKRELRHYDALPVCPQEIPPAKKAAPEKGDRSDRGASVATGATVQEPVKKKARKALSNGFPPSASPVKMHEPLLMTSSASDPTATGAVFAADSGGGASPSTGKGILKRPTARSKEGGAGAPEAKPSRRLVDARSVRRVSFNPVPQFFEIPARVPDPPQSFLSKLRWRLR